MSEGELLKRIREIHEETKAAYRSPRIYQELKGRGIPVSKGRVERLMRENGLRGRHKRRFKATTDSKHSLPVAPNRLDQNFETERPDQAWTADITYVATAEGWLYLAIVLDLYTRQIVGWAMRERMTKELVIDALRMAWFRRRPPPGLIHHSDRGSPYCSHDFQKQLAEYGMLASMSRKGNCWDNATSESFFNSLKNERVHGSRYETRDEARADLFDYVEVFYNRRRRHSALGGQSPAAVYEAWLKIQSESKLAA